MDLVQAMVISASGLRAQGTRLRIISENLANVDSTAREPGGEPYRRKLVSFGNILNRDSGVETVRVTEIFTDASNFRESGIPAIVLGPGHIAQAHTVDEWLDLDQLDLGVTVYQALMNTPMT